jgi:hypothetical protein
VKRRTDDAPSNNSDDGLEDISERRGEGGVGERQPAANWSKNYKVKTDKRLDRVISNSPDYYCITSVTVKLQANITRMRLLTG